MAQGGSVSVNRNCIINADEMAFEIEGFRPETHRKKKLLDLDCIGTGTLGLLSRIVKVLLHLNLRIRRHKVVSAGLLNTLPSIENQSNRCVFQTALCFIQSVHLPNRPRTAFFAKLIAHPTQFSRSVIRETRPLGPSSLCGTHIFLAVFTPFIERLLRWFGIRNPTCA